jgi:CubicO group peptidase (beta-lactamase class C family)
MKKIAFVLFWFVQVFWAKAQPTYFPPLSGSNWETISPDSLGWCTYQIDSLYAFLGSNNTKSFMVLKDGKIVLEKYFGSFTKDSLWYWASAAKTLTAVLVGKAQEEGKLALTDSSSKYLGAGWTNCTPEQEGKITIWHQLTMTSGLDDETPQDNHCTFDSCLLYKADPNTRWAYHNAPYTLLDSVIRVATGQTLATYTNTTVRNRIGMNGLWFKSNFDNTYVSNTRSFARFGLLAQNNFVWNTDTIISDTMYRWQMVNTSQQINKSYGYLWWLNGKSSYMVPTSQLVFQGSYAPEAPIDMFAGIGKNGQIVSVSRGERLVVIRMGDAPGTSVEVPTEFTNQIWKNLNKVMCKTPSSIAKVAKLNQVNIYPNPATTQLNIQLPSGKTAEYIRIYNMYGQLLLEAQFTNTLQIEWLPKGFYTIETCIDNEKHQHKFLKN